MAVKDNAHILSRLPEVLLPWYWQNKRELPWRQDRDPYHIWVSEIMLQQTRVEAVKGYYARFLQELPTVEALANADDERLHKLWEGLGYYSRVRNLKKAAVRILEDHGGKFPREYSAVLALPGIGEYTAGAICSIAFGQKRAAVDGNVLRLVSRLTDDPTPVDFPAYKKSVQQSLEHIYPDDAGDFTQALMELGATICGPNRDPSCALCPCRDFCLGHQRGTASQLPVKQPKKQRRQEDMTVLIMRCANRYALQKRQAEGLLANLWQFPNFSGKPDIQTVLAQVEQMGVKPVVLTRRVEKKHVFTHVQWNMSGVYLEVQEESGDFVWLSPEQINAETALPTAFRQFWEEIENV